VLSLMLAEFAINLPSVSRALPLFRGLFPSIWLKNPLNNFIHETKAFRRSVMQKELTIAACPVKKES